MEESMERLFVDGGSHPKVICRWRKSSKGYFMCTIIMEQAIITPQFQLGKHLQKSSIIPVITIEMAITSM
jgi:hypothetical protein